MLRPAHLTRRAVALAAALTVLTATAAAAHPSFNPNELPGGEPVETVLVVPHGCSPTGGMPDGDDATATTLLELQLTDAVLDLQPGEIEGWETSRDGDVVRWEDAGGATTEPIELPVTISLAGDSGEDIYLAAYQACAEGGEFRWIGTPDAEAEWPAAKLTLTSGAVGTTTPESMDHSAHDPAAHDSMHDGDHEGMEGHDEMAEADGGAAAMSGESAGDDGAPIAVIVLVVAALLTVVVALVVRRATARTAE
jgi:uncharacterized protein YcnI